MVLFLGVVVPCCGFDRSRDRMPQGPPGAALADVGYETEKSLQSWPRSGANVVVFSPWASRIWYFHYWSVAQSFGPTSAVWQVR